MISQFERYGFLGEFKIYTFRNSFPNQVPTAQDLFAQLEKLHKSQRHTLERPPRKLRIEQFRITPKGYAELLFHLTDPNIPDNVLADRTNGKLRTLKRNASEDPAISAHVVINLSSDFDQSRHYPSCIENMDYLPRSLVIQFFNEWMAATLSQQIVRKGEKEAKTFQPRFEFVAPASQTIQESLENGGVLKGVKWVEDELVEQTFGDKAFPVVKRTNVGMTVKNRPTGDAAKQVLADLCGQLTGQKPKTVKVTIQDENDREKTVSLDPARSNVLSNIFIPQAHFDNFSPPMDMCESNIRDELVKKMQKALKE